MTPAYHFYRSRKISEISKPFPVFCIPAKILVTEMIDRTHLISGSGG
jgi:hypothetical protein